MKKIFLIILLCGLVAWLTSCASHKEFPIDSVFSNLYGGEVIISIIQRDGSTELAYIPIDKLDARLRDDGKDYTSIKVETNPYSNRYGAYPSGIILVPRHEDIEKWNKWKEGLRAKPKRVFPPDD